MNENLFPQNGVFDHFKSIPDAGIGEISNLLQNALVDEMVNLDERTFCLVWLPFFAAKDNPYNVTTVMWSTVAGGHGRSVRIIDREGNELFIIPPIVNNANIKPVKGAKSILHMVITADQLKLIHPAQSEAYLNQELGKLINLDDDKKESLRQLHLWNKIFAKYDYPLIEVEGLKDPVAETTKVDKDDDIDEWEDL